MLETTLIKKREQMTRKPMHECHGGERAIDWIEVLSKEELKDKKLNFIHDDILPPGASIGVQTHERDEEYYYIVSGCGEMILNGKIFELKDSDITAVFPGGSHGLKNKGSDEMRIFVLSVS